MGKLAKLQNSSPTTKTGEKLRGRKRDPSVLQKAWETRRAKKRLAKRQGEASIKPSPLIRAAKAIRRGSTKPIRRVRKGDVLTVTATPRSEQSGKAWRDQVTRFVEPASDTANDNAGSAWQQSLDANREAAIAGDNSGRLDNPLGTVKFIADVLRKGDQQSAIERLLQITARANFEGQKRASDEADTQAARIRKLSRERVVCGFIAEVDAAMARHGGLPPDQVWTISSYTVSKIVDVLNDAGYTARGFRAPEKQGYQGK